MCFDIYLRSADHQQQNNFINFIDFQEHICKKVESWEIVFIIIFVHQLRYSRVLLEYLGAVPIYPLPISVDLEDFPFQSGEIRPAIYLPVFPQYLESVPL